MWVITSRLGRERTLAPPRRIEAMVFKTFFSPSLLYYI